MTAPSFSPDRDARPVSANLRIFLNPGVAPTDGRGPEGRGISQAPPSPRRGSLGDKTTGPAEFLSDDQVAAYERFVGDLTRSELEGLFLLDSTALDLIAGKRGAHNRLGTALQIGTVCFLGHFLTEDPLEVPSPAVEYVAGQLDIEDPSVVKRYTERQQTAYEHSWEIRRAYGYRDFVDAGVREDSDQRVYRTSTPPCCR